MNARQVDHGHLGVKIGCDKEMPLPIIVSYSNQHNSDVKKCASFLTKLRKNELAIVPELSELLRSS